MAGNTPVDGNRGIQISGGDNRFGAAAAGEQAVATNTETRYGEGSGPATLNFEALVTQLETLRKAAQLEAKDSEHYKALVGISEAEDAAKKKDPNAVLSALKQAGQWGLEIASKIGVSVAAEAIKKSMHL